MIETTYRTMHDKALDDLVTDEYQWYIFRDGPTILYVGQSTKILQRIRNHQMHYPIRRFLNDWQIQLLTRKDVIEIVGHTDGGCEYALIKHLQPHLNQRGIICGNIRVLGTSSVLIEQQESMQVLEWMREGIVISVHIRYPRFSGHLPKKYQSKLNLIDTSARLYLNRNFFKSRWGAFVLREMYPQWKKENARLEAKFWELKKDMMTNYESIIEQIVEESRPKAEEAWLRAGLELLEKEHFIENYLSNVRNTLPEKWEVENGFSYEIERTFIPLLSLLTHGMEDDREMEKDILSDARRLAQEFYTDIVKQINELFNSAAVNILDSLDASGGILRGRVSVQLSNLVKQLEQLNFVENELIKDQLSRLREVLPTEEEREKASKGLARIDTVRISQVLGIINEEAEQILISLGIEPKIPKHGTTEQS